MNALYKVKPVDSDSILARGREVVGLEKAALGLLQQSLDENFVAACEALFATKRQLVVTGMGKSGHIARKVAATFAATGTPAVFIHPAEASHGDLGMLVKGDVLLVLSNSGNTAELRSILTYSRSIGVQIIGVAARATSVLMELADIAICLPMVREACMANVAPTTSTTLQLALGDALAIAVMEMRGVSKNYLRSLHPGGKIGIDLARVAEVMHGAERLPLVHEGDGMSEAISRMTSERFGLAGVIDEQGQLLGVISDGDLRRHFDKLSSALAGEVMNRSPRTLPIDMPATEALHFLNENKITAAFVIDPTAWLNPNCPVGIVHMHDLLPYGMS